MFDGLEVTKAEQYVQDKGWEYRLNGDQLNIKVCPLPECGDDRYKFYLNSKTFLWQCHKCKAAGNEFKLKAALKDPVSQPQQQGDGIDRGMSTRQPPQRMPKHEAAHERLLADDELMNYLNDERGWSAELVKRMQLGVEDHGFEKDGVVTTHKCILYPYLIGGELKFAKWRTLPPAKKDFRSTQGHSAPLYNQDAITKGMEELILVEGESDTLSCLTNGIENVAGVPGADSKKVAWDKYLTYPQKIYLLFDNDEAGQEGARKFAVRFGIDRFHNIKLPKFDKADGTEGKDIGEWFLAGHTMDEFNSLKEMAELFDVEGVSTNEDALDELENEVEENGLKPEFEPMWPSLAAKLGGYSRGQLIAVSAEGKVGKTTVVLNELDHQADQGHTCMMACFEMPKKEMVKKWVSYKSKTDISPYPGVDPIEKAAYQKAKDEEFKAGLQIAREHLKTRKGELLFANSNSLNNVDQLYDMIINAKRRYDVDIVCVDNLQLIADSTLRSAAHRTTHLSQITKRLKRLCEELQIVIFLIVQPKRVQEGEVVGARHSEGGSAVEKDVDAYIAFHRNRELKVKASELDAMGQMDVANFSPRLYGRVDLSRYAPGGPFVLHIDGGRSWVREIGEADIYEKTVTSGTVIGSLPMEEVGV